jgi:hypothetical protein
VSEQPETASGTRMAASPRNSRRHLAPTDTGAI